MFLTARRLRLLLRIFLALLLVLSVLLATAFYLLQRNPEALTRHYLDGISARTGLIFCVEAVDVYNSKCNILSFCGSGEG